MDESCRACREEVVMQIFKGTGVCCELCRKVDAGEMSPSEWVTLKEVNVDVRAEASRTKA